MRISRIVKLAGALAGALALSAIAVSASASAAEIAWKWLPGTAGETFTGKSGKASFQVKEGTKGEKPGTSITCAKSLILLTFGGNSSELLKEGSTEGKDATQALALMHLESCTTAGLPSNSVGDEKGVILLHLEIQNCMITKGGKFGLLFKLLPVSLEVPSTKLTIALEGSFVAAIESEAGNKETFKLKIKQKEGTQEIEKCEGGAAETLLTNVDASKNVATGVEALEGILTFDKTKDADEEMMEK